MDKIDRAAYDARRLQWRLWDACFVSDAPSPTNPNSWRYKTMTPAQANASRAQVTATARQAGVRLVEVYTNLATGQRIERMLT